MVLVITTICAAVLLAVVLAKRVRDRREEMERYTITPQALHALLASNQEVLVIGVRQPLDLLGDSVIIPGATWVAPQSSCTSEGYPYQIEPSNFPNEGGFRNNVFKGIDFPSIQWSVY